MSDELTVEINTKNLELALRIFPKELKNELGDGFDHISKKFLGTWRQARLKGSPGVMGHRQSGLFGKFFRASLVPGQSEGIQGMGMIIFTDSKIANLQEFGGRVTDPSGGKIAVPLSARSEMFNSEGHLRKQYKDVRAMRGSKRIFMTKINNKTFLAKATGKRGMLPLFVLKNGVRIKPRLGFYDTWNSLQNERITILNQSVKKALDNTK